MTSVASTPKGLATALSAGGSSVASLAIFDNGVWSVWIAGAPDIVNSAFPASLPATWPFFVRCS